eukprot:11603559-Alexandrium_andersonii.AAC.1
MKQWRKEAAAAFAVHEQIHPANTQRALDVGDADLFWRHWSAVVQSSLVDARKNNERVEGMNFDGHGKVRLVKCEPGPGEFRVEVQEDEAV